MNKHDINKFWSTWCEDFLQQQLITERAARELPDGNINKLLLKGQAMLLLSMQYAMAEISNKEDDFRAYCNEGNPAQVEGDLYIETFDEEELKNKILVYRGKTKIGFVYKHPRDGNWAFKLIKPIHELRHETVLVICDLLSLPEKTIETIKGKGKQKYFSDYRIVLKPDGS